MAIDDRNDDHELKAYLDGRDGVSAAYRKSAQEEPSRALDQAILNAARKGMVDRNSAKPRPSRQTWYASRSSYALAASVMIAVVATSLYFSTLDERVVSSPDIEQVGARAVEIQLAEERVDAADAEGGTGAPAAAAQDESQTASTVQLEFQTRQLAPPVDTVGAVDIASTAPVPGAGITNDAFARAGATPAPIVIDGPLLEAIEADAAAAEAARQGSTQEEIIVTGSRIVRREEGDLSYRESRADWLYQISLMVDERDASARLTTARAATARLEQNLEAEVELFLDTYPGTDIEAELEALEE